MTRDAALRRRTILSGGVAFVLDEDGNFRHRCNLEMVELEPVADTLTSVSHLGMSDTALLKSMIENHARHTGSMRALDILGNWPKWSRTFVKVMPIEYRRALKQLAEKSAAALKQKAA